MTDVELPPIEQFVALTQARRSIHGFDRSRDVPDESIQLILEAARWAPSGGNGQPWQFIVIRDAAMRHRIADLYEKQLEPKREMELAVRGQVRMTGAGFRHAPVFIIVLGDPRVNLSYPVRTMLEKSARHFYSGLANACLSLMLAATCLGLAAQYCSDASSPYMSTMLKVWLGVPDPLEVYELIPIGWPNVQVAAPPRRRLDDLVHREHYDMEKYVSDEQMRQWLWTESRLGAYGKGPSPAAKERGLIE